MPCRWRVDEGQKTGHVPKYEYLGSRVTLLVPASLRPAGCAARVPLGSFQALKWNCLMPAPVHRSSSGVCPVTMTEKLDSALTYMRVSTACKGCLCPMHPPPSFAVCESYSVALCALACIG